MVSEIDIVSHLSTLPLPEPVDVPILAIDNTGMRLPLREFRMLCGVYDKQGSLMPVILRRNWNGRYSVIDGAHRLRYLKLRGAKTVSAIILEEECHDNVEKETEG